MYDYTGMHPGDKTGITLSIDGTLVLSTDMKAWCVLLAISTIAHPGDTSIYSNCCSRRRDIVPEYQ